MEVSNVRKPVVNTMQFARELNDVLDRLYGKLPVDAGIPLAEIKRRTSHLHVSLPMPLAVLYQIAGQFPPVMSVYNEFLPPEDLILRRHMLVFCIENQGVTEWGFSTNRAMGDPPVKCFSDTWYSDSSSLSLFVSRMVYWQAVNGGLPFGGATYITKRQLKGIIDVWPTAEFGGKRIDKRNDLRFWTKDRIVLAVAGPRDDWAMAAPEERYFLFVGCESQQSLRKIEGMHDIDLSG